MGRDMATTRLLLAIVVAVLQLLVASASEHRIIYQLQGTCDPVVLQAATAVEQADLRVKPQDIWKFLSSSVEYQGDGWFAPRPTILPRVLRPFIGGVLRMSYSVYSQLVVLDLSNKEEADGALSRLKEWGAAGGCVSALSQDHALLSVQQAGNVGAQGSRDPQLRDQWGLFAIDVMNDRSQHVQGAWSSTTGEAAVTVAVVDTGIHFSHPELQHNAWKNTEDVTGDHMDNDGNGFVDDYMGFNFVDDSADVSDAHGHGTHMAGVIGAEGNNGVGIVGVSMNVRLMALKAFNQEGKGRMSDVIRALDYAAFMGAHEVLLAASSGDPSKVAADTNLGPLEKAAAALESEGILLVTAAGNEQLDLHEHPRFPASWELDNMIVVAASSGTETIAGFSNYGPGQVNLLAPGVSIITTAPRGDLVPVSGTSVAASFVAGVAALLLSDLAKNGQAYRGCGHWVKSILTNSVEYHTQYAPWVASGGRVNAGKALALQQQLLDLPRAQEPDSTMDWRKESPQASPRSVRLDKSMHSMKGYGPVMRVDVSLSKVSQSSLKDTEMPLPGLSMPLPVQQDAAQQTKQLTQAATSTSRFRWLWDSIKDARLGGLFHGCDDLHDCGAKK